MTEEWEKKLPPFKVQWTIVTGKGLGQWVVLDEDFETEEQARAIFDGYGPTPRAWWEVRVARKHGRGLYFEVVLKSRKRKTAEAEIEVVTEQKAS